MCNILAHVGTASVHHATPSSPIAIHSNTAAPAIEDIVLLVSSSAWARHGHKSNCALRRGGLSHCVSIWEVASKQNADFDIYRKGRRSSGTSSLKIEGAWLVFVPFGASLAAHSRFADRGRIPHHRCHSPDWYGTIPSASQDMLLDIRSYFVRS
jgi:hypothetical protein